MGKFHVTWRVMENGHCVAYGETMKQASSLESLASELTAVLERTLGSVTELANRTFEIEVKEAVLMINGTIRLHVPAKYGTDTSREFDPSAETHNFGFLVKIVDPGCTLELQIEERSGRVTRVTSTEDADADRAFIPIRDNGSRYADVR